MQRATLAPAGGPRVAKKLSRAVTESHFSGYDTRESSCSADVDPKCPTGARRPPHDESAGSGTDPGPRIASKK